MKLYKRLVYIVIGLTLTMITVFFIVPAVVYTIKQMFSLVLVGIQHPAIVLMVIGIPTLICMSYTIHNENKLK